MRQRHEGRKGGEGVVEGGREAKTPCFCLVKSPSDTQPLPMYSIYTHAIHNVSQKTGRVPEDRGRRGRPLFPKRDTKPAGPEAL
jgi:hypothetical protein